MKCFIRQLKLRTTQLQQVPSAGNTTTTELTLTGLVLGQTYSIFEKAFGPEGAPVLPMASAHSMAGLVTVLAVQPC